MSDPVILAHFISTGAVWTAPGWVVQMAVDAINNGDVPMPTNIPEEYRPYITATTPPPEVPPTDPLTGGPPIV
jgi:hypothetical protein